MLRLSINSSASNFAQDLILAEKLVLLGARPPIVRSLCNVGRKLAIRIYKGIHQQPPKQGMLPYDGYWIVRSSGNDIHASIFLGIVQDLLRLQNQQSNNTSIFITAFELYSRVVKNNPRPSKLELSAEQFKLLDINRAWHILQQFNTHEIGFEHCEKCKARYLALNAVPKTFQLCPVCDVWTDKDGRRRWASGKNRQNLRQSDGFSIGTQMDD